MLKAYTVLETDESTGGVVFAASNTQAKRLGASRFHGGDTDYLECRRAPQWDRFAEAGEVPDLVLWRAGWNFECHCGRRIDDSFGCDLEDREEAYEDEPVGVEPIMFGRSLFCGWKCVIGVAESRARQKADERTAVILCARHLPEGCEVKRGYRGSMTVMGTDPHRPGRQAYTFVECWCAEFDFPGSVYGGWIRIPYALPHGEADITTAGGDALAWHQFRGTTPPENVREDYERMHATARRLSGQEPAISN